MSKIDDFNAAFPNEYTEGMTLRDWFASQALAGMLADSNYTCSSKEAATAAYQYADAMLAERSKGGSK